uniref:Uncharacterized protein n=1 Tax=Oryza meridionalis TaxID=40149 RepID=A0A0E0F228_9ORYZ
MGGDGNRVAMTNELKRCSTPSEEKEAKRMKKEAVKPMEWVQRLLSMEPRAPVPLPVIRNDSPELKEIDKSLANVVQALNSSARCRPTLSTSCGPKATLTPMTSS